MRAELYCPADKFGGSARLMLKPILTNLQFVFSGIEGIHYGKIHYATWETSDRASNAPMDISGFPRRYSNDKKKTYSGRQFEMSWPDRYGDDRSVGSGKILEVLDPDWEYLVDALIVFDNNSKDAAKANNLQLVNFEFPNLDARWNGHYELIASEHAPFHGRLCLHDLRLLARTDGTCDRPFSSGEQFVAHLNGDQVASGSVVCVPEQVRLIGEPHI